MHKMAEADWYMHLPPTNVQMQKRCPIEMTNTICSPPGSLSITQPIILNVPTLISIEPKINDDNFSMLHQPNEKIYSSLDYYNLGHVLVKANLKSQTAYMYCIAE